MADRSRNSNVTFDGTGYVNNIGESIYWGVSFYTIDAANARSDRKIRININENNNSRTKHDIKADDFTLSEELAAHVAAVYYEFETDRLEKRKSKINPYTDIFYVFYDRVFYRVNASQRNIRRVFITPSRDVVVYPKGDYAPFKAKPTPVVQQKPTKQQNKQVDVKRSAEFFDKFIELTFDYRDCLTEEFKQAAIKVIQKL